LKKFLQTIDRAVPADLDVHLILDNASTHKTPAIKAWLDAHPRFVVHFTPTSSSWLNLVERWFGEPTTRKNGAAPTAPSVSSTPTSAPGPTPGTRTPPLRLDQDRDDILESIATYCKRINDTSSRPSGSRAAQTSAAPCRLPSSSLITGLRCITKAHAFNHPVARSSRPPVGPIRDRLI
jgi:hypothetical protein